MMIIDSRVRPPYKSLNQVLASAPGSRKPTRRSPLISGYERSPSMVQKSLDLFIKEMDEAGIDKGVLVGRQSGHRIISNDDIAELRDMFPDRFPVAIAGINGSDGKAALKEIERTIASMGFRGIAVDPGWLDPPLFVDDRRLYPLYSKCSDLGGVLYITCSLMQGPDISYAKPERIQRVANDFPSLPMVVVHGAFPFTHEMLGVMIANAPLGNLWVMPDFFHFIPGFAGAQDWVDAANSYLGDRMIYASSYPVRPLKQSIEEFKRFAYQKDVLENLMARNAKALFGI